MRSITLVVAVDVDLDLDLAVTPFTKGIETEWPRQRIFVGSVRSMKARFFRRKNFQGQNGSTTSINCVIHRHHFN